MNQKHPKYFAPPVIRQRAKELWWKMTPAETPLWEHLKTKQLHGLKFRRQHPLHYFILDFYCHVHQSVIEVDGGIHRQQREYDEACIQWLNQRGFKVIRFTNGEVYNHFETVFDKIAKACNVH